METSHRPRRATSGRGDRPIEEDGARLGGTFAARRGLSRRARCPYDRGGGESSAGELSARLEGDGAETPRWWEHLHAADLFLASACARGVAGALDRFERLHGD